MKIAYCYPETLPSETARSIQTVHTCCALSKQVERVFLYLPCTSPKKKELFSFYGIDPPDNLVVRYCKKRIGPVSSNHVFNFFLKSALHNDRPHVIITRHLKTARALLHAPEPLLFEAHEVFSEKKSAAQRNLKIERLVLAHAKGVTCLTRGLLHALQSSYPSAARFSVVPSGTHVPEAMPLRQNHTEEPVRILYLGSTRYAWKGMDTLLSAMNLLPELITLEIVGRLDHMYERQNHISRLIRLGRVRVTGQLHPDEARQRLREAHVAVIPNSGKDPISRLYTSPLKLLEAMAAAVIVVASDLPSIREIVSQDQAILVRPDDAGALAQGILKAALDPVLRTTLSRNAWLRVQNFSWEKRAEKIIRLAEEVLVHPAS